MYTRIKAVFVTILVLAFLSGLCLCLYPVVHGAILDHTADREASSFLEQVQDSPNPLPNLIPDSTEPARKNPELWEAVQSYNHTIWQEKQSGLTDPWAYEQPSFQLWNYGIPDEVFAVISIPSLSLELPIYLGATNEHMASGAAHLSQTSLWAAKTPTA